MKKLKSIIVVLVGILAFIGGIMLSSLLIDCIVSGLSGDLQTAIKIVLWVLFIAPIIGFSTFLSGLFSILVGWMLDMF